MSARLATGIGKVAGEVIDYAERFAAGLPAEFEGMVGPDVRPALRDFGCRLALAILRPEIVALRRLLIGEARAFPELVRGYFDRAPGQVLGALATGLRQLEKAGLLRVDDPRRAAEQFAYLVVGAPLDRAILVGTVPAEREIVDCAEAGVETFLARYGE